MVIDVTCDSPQVGHCLFQLSLRVLNVSRNGLDLRICCIDGLLCRVDGLLLLLLLCRDPRLQALNLLLGVHLGLAYGAISCSPLPIQLIFKRADCPTAILDALKRLGPHLIKSLGKTAVQLRQVGSVLGLNLSAAA